MSHPFARFLAVTPGPFLAWINQWQEPLSGTPLSYYRWQDAADSTAAWISTGLAILIFAATAPTAVAWMRRLAWVSFSVSIAMVVVCLSFFYSLGPPGDASIVVWKQSVWMYAYILMVCAMLASIMLALRAHFAP